MVWDILYVWKRRMGIRYNITANEGSQFFYCKCIINIVLVYIVVLRLIVRINVANHFN